MERTELYGLPRQDFLFILKNVACTPKAPRQKEVITIKGEVDLFKIPFYAPVWVIASVTYPEKWWEVLGSPTVHEMTVAIGGKFEIKFAEGFDRDGEYSLAVNLYFGPTITTTLGTLKSVTLPPLPSLDTYEAKFTVAGAMPPEQNQYIIGKPTVIPSVIVEGTNVTISVPVTSGAAQQETVIVRLKVDYGSALTGPGSTIKTISSSPTVMNPGDSLIFTCSYTEVAPNDGRRDTEVDVLVNGTSKGYDHQNDLWTVSPAGGLTQGTVNFTCDSPVEIYVDFVHYGKTPISINLFTGNRNWVAIDIQGNQTSGQVNVVTGQTQNVKVPFPFPAQTGTLHITFTPTNATVTVDGNPVTNGGSYQLSIGYHTWDAQASGYYRDNAQFLILLNQTTDIKILLIAIPDGGAPPVTYSLYTAVAPYGGGSISPASGSWPAGTIITLQAIPASGNVFDYWGGDASGTANPIQITMNSDKNVNAYFKAPTPPQYTLTINITPVGAGYVTKAPDLAQYSTGQQVTLTAYRYDPYYFNYFSGDTGVGDVYWGQLLVTITKNSVITAHYK